MSNNGHVLRFSQTHRRLYYRSIILPSSLSNFSYHRQIFDCSEDLIVTFFIESVAFRPLDNLAFFFLYYFFFGSCEPPNLLMDYGILRIYQKNEPKF